MKNANTMALVGMRLIGTNASTGKADEYSQQPSLQ